MDQTRARVGVNVESRHDRYLRNSRRSFLTCPLRVAHPFNKQTPLETEPMCKIQTALALIAIVAVAACGDDDPDRDVADTGAASSDVADTGDASSDVAASTQDSGADADTGADAAVEAGLPDVSSSPWFDICTTDEECAAPTDYCVTQPGAPEGYCTIRCEGLDACSDSPGWTCNTVSFAGCDDVSTNWCGPLDELETFAGVIIACE